MFRCVKPQQENQHQIPGQHRFSYHIVHNGLRDAGSFPRRQCDVTFWPRHLEEHLQFDGHLPFGGLLCSQMSLIFLLSCADGHICVYILQLDHYDSKCMQQGDHFGGDSVIVWSWIHQDNGTALVYVADALKGIRYQEVLQHHVIHVNGGMPDHVLHVFRVSAELQSLDITLAGLDITLACLFAGFIPA